MFSHEQKLEEYKSLFISLEAQIHQGIMDINLDRAKHPNKFKRKEDFTFDEIMSIDSFTFKKKQFKDLTESELIKADISILSSLSYKTDENTDGSLEERKRTRAIFYIRKFTKLRELGVEGFNEDFLSYYKIYTAFNRFKTVLADLEAYIDFEFMDLSRLELIGFILSEEVVVPSNTMYEAFKALLKEKTDMVKGIQNKRSLELKDYMKVSKHRNKRTKKEGV